MITPKNSKLKVVLTSKIEGPGKDFKSGLCSNILNLQYSIKNFYNGTDL